MFLALKGSFRIEFRDRTVELKVGDFVIVPRGIEHRPVADEEVEVLLFEPANLKNTGNIEDREFTFSILGSSDLKTLRQKLPKQIFQANPCFKNPCAMSAFRKDFYFVFFVRARFL